MRAGAKTIERAVTHLRRTVEQLAWMERAACNRWWCKAPIDEQIATCLGCPVRAQCLEYAMEVEKDLYLTEIARYGEIYGGLTGRERARLRGAS